MKKITLTIILISMLPSMLFAQSVGLVMSGGGARGLAHIGVIKVLEENNIPIDYVAGTSMGAIVAALYSMGYTPDEMIEKMKSEDFQRWYTGTMDQKYMFYFRKNNDVPDILRINFDIKDSLRIVRPSANIVKSTPMNLGFLEIFAGSNAACNGNFDNLMVPFRCVASDVYEKKQVVFSKGDLGDAVRASMSYPFFFKPIKVNNVLLYDGGIYNNFPRDVMERDFNPDIIIGSVVSENPEPPGERDIMGQATNLIMGRSDYSLPEEKGVLLNMQVKGVNLLDFHKIDDITAIGYNHAKNNIDSIKKRITRREDNSLLAEKRRKFKERIPEFKFKDIVVNGVNEEQRKHIIKEFKRNGEIFDYQDCKRSYYSLLSGEIIEAIIPHAIYNEQDSTYTLHLDVTMNPAFTIKMGAAVSTSISNQIYLGLHFRNLHRHSKEFIVDGQVGKVYNNIQASGRIDFLTSLPISLKVIGSYSTIHYYNMKYVFSKENSIALNHQREMFAKVKISLPFLTKKKAEIGIGIADIKDKYMPMNIIDLNSPQFDKNDMTLYGGFVKFGGNTFDTKVFPTSGSFESLIAQFFVGKERYRGIVPVETGSQNLSWLQLTYTRRDHYRISEHFRLGTHMQIHYSTRHLAKTYQATMMQASAFTPTMNSLFNYDPKFRAHQYVAGGLTPIIKFRQLFQIRPSIYFFLPYRKIEENADGTASFSKKRFNDFQYICDLTIAAKISKISISGFVNYYSSHDKSINVGVTLGWFMFNERFIEQ